MHQTLSDSHFCWSQSKTKVQTREFNWNKIALTWGKIHARNSATPARTNVSELAANQMPKASLWPRCVSALFLHWWTHHPKKWKMSFSLITAVPIHIRAGCKSVPAARRNGRGTVTAASTTPGVCCHAAPTPTSSSGRRPYPFSRREKAFGQ